jgi:hypothetical protein
MGFVCSLHLAKLTSTTLADRIAGAHSNMRTLLATVVLMKHLRDVCVAERLPLSIAGPISG